MFRYSIEERVDWKTIVESQGFDFHTIDGMKYWDESAYYSFSADEIDQLESATAELHRLCIDAAEYVIENRLYSKLAIPEKIIPLIERSFENDEPSIYGRFDLAFDGKSPPKMLEYNADTPTAILEASVIQWFWLKDKFPERDQFNSIHEKLIDGWRDLKNYMEEPLYFAASKDSAEDFGSVEYLRDTAMQAGLQTSFINIEDIGIDTSSGSFIDMQNNSIQTLFKLYPWEWLANETYSRYLIPSKIVMIEPAWKLILSNKAILPILWELNEGHPNLLEASFDTEKFRDNYLIKPFFAREGANITICQNGEIFKTDGSYNTLKAVSQKMASIPSFEGNYPVIGAWVIYGEPAGIGIREEKSKITTNLSRFVPHIFI